MDLISPDVHNGEDSEKSAVLVSLAEVRNYVLIYTALFCRRTIDADHLIEVFLSVGSLILLDFYSLLPPELVDAQVGRGFVEEVNSPLS